MLHVANSPLAVPDRVETNRFMMLVLGSSALDRDDLY